MDTIEKGLWFTGLVLVLAYDSILITIILKTWPPFHTCPPHWTASPWELWTCPWTELLQLVFLLEKLELMVGSSAHLPYFKGLILSYSKIKVFHVILLFWGIFSNILMLACIEFCFRWSLGTQLVNISLEYHLNLYVDGKITFSAFRKCPGVPTEVF